MNEHKQTGRLGDWETGRGICLLLSKSPSLPLLIMSYDPTKPANGSPLNSAEMRGLLQGLKTLIDAILTITAAQVDGVNTVNPGDPANVAVTVIGNTLHFTFDLPRGNDGGPGPQGPPFADAVVDGVTTLDPGELASVTVSFDGTSVHFQFAIPRGQEGPQGQPGEVSQAAPREIPAAR